MRPYVEQKSDLRDVWGIFIIVPEFRAASKISDLLTSGDPDIKLICINCMLVNKGVHKEQNEWSLVKLF